MLQVGCVCSLQGFDPDPIAALDKVAERGLQGVQLPMLESLSPELDLGRLREIKSHADRLGLFFHVSLYPLNPFNIQGDPDAFRRRLRQEIEICAQLGMTEIRGAMGGPHNRMGQPVAWSVQLEETAIFLRALSPVLRDLKVRINIENHGDASTFELARLIEEIGADAFGVCLDTANVLVSVEEPLAAFRRVAPYVGLTHAKDAIIFLSDQGIERHVRPAGQGVIPWPEILSELSKINPEITLAIEDHKEPGALTYSLPIYDSAWLAHFPDLSADELAQLVKVADRTRRSIDQGATPAPADVDAATWNDGGFSRLDQGVAYLKELVNTLGLSA